MSPFPHRKRIAVATAAGLVAVTLCVVLYLWLQRTHITVTVYDPPLVYAGATETRELAKRIPQLETRQEMTQASTLEQFHRWMTPQLASRRSALPERSGPMSEVLARFPEGVVYAVIEIRKQTRHFSLLVDAGQPPDARIYDSGQNKPLLIYVNHRGRWLAAAADEFPIKELHAVINATALHDLDETLSKKDLNLLLRDL